MTTPLIPTGPDEARALWQLLVSEIEERMHADGTAIRLLATECVAHLAAVFNEAAPGPRIVVLAGPDPGALVRLASTASLAMDLPSALIPITAVSENGWHGRGLDKWLDALRTCHPRAGVWARHGIVTFSGLEALRIISGTYESSSDSTRDYRSGKAEDLASLLRGEPTTCMVGDHPWDAQRAMVFVTATYDEDLHDTDALQAWGLPPSLARVLSGATWLRVPAAAGRVLERAVWDHLEPLRQLYEVYGVLLDVAPETVRVASLRASERGETAAVAASWIAAPARLRLSRLIADDARESYVVVGPDDAPVPPASRGSWVD